MTKLTVKLTAIFIIAAIVLSGCTNSDSSGKSPMKADSDVRMNTVNILLQQNLPALESVELWENEYGPGLKLATAHYEIFTTLPDPLMLSELPGFIESAYRGYQRQLGKSIETSSRFTIYLFAKRGQWEDFTKSYTGKQAPLYLKIKAGAYYLKGSCVTYNIGRERTFSVLGHEGWHQFNSRFFRYRLPSWLDEGIAMQFEAGRYEQGMFYFEPGKNLYRLGGLKQTLAKQKMMRLEELIGINPGEAITASDDAVTAFYAQSYAMVRFLREEGYGKRLVDFQRMLLGGLDGTWSLGDKAEEIAADRNIPLTVWWNRAVGLVLFRLYISDDLEQIEREYVAFCRKIVYRIRIKE